eukprot:gene6198-8536_t
MKKISLLFILIDWLVYFGVFTTTTNGLSQPTAKLDLFTQFCRAQQQNIISLIEAEDTKQFKQESWSKGGEESKNLNDKTAGNGITAVLVGEIWEKAAVSTTFACGILSADRANAISSRQGLQNKELVGMRYNAAALSLVMHSRSPLVPTFRADIRYFELENGIGWFGGGADLTPYYLFDEDATYFHSTYRNVCGKYSDALYDRLKKWCDDYFYLPARQEHRGVGGIFFDDLPCSNNEGLDDNMNFTFDVCHSFMTSYLPIVRRHKNKTYSESQRHWQLLRRGRYIEFNLLYDRGVRFGLVPGGRIEAVLVSCPPLVAWDYDVKLENNSEEERLMNILKHPKAW